jgi:hypothetical protein
MTAMPEVSSLVQRRLAELMLLDFDAITDVPGLVRQSCGGYRCRRQKQAHQGEAGYQLGFHRLPLLGQIVLDPAMIVWGASGSAMCGAEHKRQ